MPVLWPVPVGAGIAVAAAAATLAAAARRRLTVVVVDGESMSPALHSGDRLLVRRRATGPTVGEVVVFRLPGRPDSRLIKRVAAVAGDPVPAAALAAVGAQPGARVPDGALVVFGDAAHSTDSRRWGYLPTGQVTGVVVRPLRRRPADRGPNPVGGADAGPGSAGPAGGRAATGRPPAK